MSGKSSSDIAFLSSFNLTSDQHISLLRKVRTHVSQISQNPSYRASSQATRLSLKIISTWRDRPVTILRTTGSKKEAKIDRQRRDLEGLNWCSEPFFSQQLHPGAAVIHYVLKGG